MSVGVLEYTANSFRNTCERVKYFKIVTGELPYRWFLRFSYRLLATLPECANNWTHLFSNSSVLRKPVCVMYGIYISFIPNLIYKIKLLFQAFSIPEMEKVRKIGLSSSMPFAARLKQFFQLIVLIIAYFYSSIWKMYLRLLWVVP